MSVKDMIAGVVSFSESKISDQWRLNTHQTLGLVGSGTSQLISECVSKISPGFCYLEVGIYQGANFFAVAAKNHSIPCLGVDNFSQEFSEKEAFGGASSLEIVQSRLGYWKKQGRTNMNVMKIDLREFFRSAKMSSPAQVYLFDGPHELSDQVDGVEMAFPHLADEAIIFVDDWHNPHTQESAKILLERYPNNLKPLRIFAEPSGDREKFHQGQIVFQFRR